MATHIKDTQLNEELQELYIISSHWQSDISFVLDEIRILNNALYKYRSFIKNLPTNQTTGFSNILSTETTKAVALKNKISVFMDFMQLFITDSEKEIGVDLLEKFSELGTATQSLLSNIKVIKKSVYAFIENAIRTDKYTQPQATSKPAAKQVKKPITQML